ncbi:MAG: oligopeptide ABC transporter substrate-binding protein OppA, partial [Moraxellaceae bacterium]|nr:oligopeptide ABC transporter substrate-binding protein OppA [Moraxellaceae bacterium]
MSKNISLFGTTAIALGMAVALTACGKPAEQADSKEKSAEKATSTEKAPVGELAEKQEIVINNGTEPTSLDPHKVSGVPESNLIRQFLEGLTTTDVDGNTVAGIAESWESPDNKVWTFKLRDAKWSNGDPVTAGDFVYSLQRLADPKAASPYSSYIDDAKIANAQAIIDGKAKVDTLGVKAVDDKTLEITLSEPVPYLPDVMIHTAVKPVHQKTVEKFGDKWTDPKNIVVNGA